MLHRKLANIKKLFDFLHILLNTGVLRPALELPLMFLRFVRLQDFSATNSNLRVAHCCAADGSCLPRVRISVTLTVEKISWERRYLFIPSVALYALIGF